MPIDFPNDLDSFHAMLKRRIRDQSEIDEHHARAVLERNVEWRDFSSQKQEHIIGQTGCFCMDCIMHRKQEWRIGDINPAIVGPRDQWRQYTWGNTERNALYGNTLTSSTELSLTPSIKEEIQVHNLKKRLLTLKRDAKFVAVVSGKYHTLMLSESAGVFACGDNSYGALGISSSLTCKPNTVSSPLQVEFGTPKAEGYVQIIAAAGYASFALVVRTVLEEPRKANRKNPIDMPARDKSKLNDQGETPTYNYLFSWGRGDCGVLGHGDTLSSCTPRIIELFNTKRVIQLSAGLHHVLVLTEQDGVFAFGDGSHGKLGVGDLNNRYAPVKVMGLDGLNAVHVSAGDDHSLAMTGETFFNRQVYSWGYGANGRLGHNDEQMRVIPTRINFFRGRKVITVAAGGAHNLATSATTNGVCVWSWGCGTYGQLGHRDTWDSMLPRSIDEIRREKITYVDAGERHSLAISDTQQLWVWGQGVHGAYDVPNPDPSSTSILHPIQVQIPGMRLISAEAGRGRTFVWGDKAIEGSTKDRCFEGSEHNVCSSLPEYETLTSDTFRVLYRCGQCKLNALCIACAHRCHVQHCLELFWAMGDSLDRDCDCFYSGKCGFQAEADIHLDSF